MNCSDLESILCDYIDETLAPGQRAEVEQHLAGCAGCSELARDCKAAVDFISRAEDVQPPAELLNHIVFSLPTQTHQPRSKGVRQTVRQWFQPILQPRFAMGMAMTILSFSMLARFAGVSARQLTPADLSPVRIWHSIDDRAHRAWDSTVKFYDSLRVVYEIQTQIAEWTKEDQQEGVAEQRQRQRDGAEDRRQSPNVENRQ